MATETRRSANAGSDRRGSERWKTLAIELRPDDLEATRPFGSGLVPADVARAQHYFRDHVHRGDPIALELVHVRDTEAGRIPLYAALHEETAIGETGEELGRALSRRLATTGGT